MSEPQVKVPKIIFATRNAHKLQEVRAILAHVIPGLDTELIGSAAELGLPEPVEDGLTFEANALIKARQIVAATGLPAFADDSGLCVQVLGEAPGIFSARWCGHHGDDGANLDLLLAQLADVPPEHRQAHFACAAVLVEPAEAGDERGGAVTAQRGDIYGTLRYERAGEGGFGYDPIFQPDGDSRTLAEFSAAEKNEVSHRRRAFEALAPSIAQILERDKRNK